MQNSPKDLRKKILGRRGEDLAAKYLKARGYKILERNYKTPFGEADLVAFKDGVYCFVEVKTRTQDAFGAPSEAVDSRKRERYRKIAASYCLMLGEEVNVRYDVAAIMSGEVDYLEGAFV